MKIVKVLFIFALVSMIAVSCKETKKEEVQDESAVEMTDDGSASGDVESTEGTSEGEESSDPANDKVEAVGAAKAIEGETKGVEEMVVPEGVIAEKLADTPVIYPGCEGGPEEIRACSKEKFISFLKKEFNERLASDLNLDPGDYNINSIIHIDEAGKCSVVKVDGGHEILKKEMTRVIGKLPQLTPATKGGKPVSVSFVLPFNYKVRV